MKAESNFIYFSAFLRVFDLNTYFAAAVTFTSTVLVGSSLWYVNRIGKPSSLNP
jgi:hypothetical protein